MVSETRSSRKNKDKVDDNNVKKESSHAEGFSKCSLKKAHISGVMKSSKQASSERKMIPSSKIDHESKNHSKLISPSTPPATRKSERLEKQNTQDPGRSGRNKKNMSYSSGSKQPVKEITLSNLKRKEKKEENLMPVTMEYGKAELGLESIGVKRKRMDARSFKSLFRRQRIKIVLSVAESTTLPSAKSENTCLLGTCLLCYKKRRLSYGSAEQELCSCSSAVYEDQSSFRASKERGDLGNVNPLESSENCDYRNPCKETYSEHQMDGHENACVVCDNDGELLCCVGKGCKRCYHHYCLDPPLTASLPGVWHCPECVKKKFMSGVLSVTVGVESIWDVREVDVSNATGMHRQKQFFVKYQGLAHVHNHWVSENQLCLENPCLISKFHAKDEILSWNSEWTIPHRLLRKRPLNKFHSSSSVDVSECHYEWLVKWHGLNYDQCTWELESAYFLSSDLFQRLMKDYENRLEKAKKLNKPARRSLDILSELPSSELWVNDSNLLKNVNKLREYWFKCQNAVVFDNQEQEMTVVFFIQSMKDMCQPFLLVVSSDSLSQWEAEFARLAPAVDVVVYVGNRDTRKGIRASEFYEGNHVMAQVLLSSSQVVFEDLDTLRGIQWEAVIVGDYQYSGTQNTLKAIKMLTANLRIVLVNDEKEGPPRENVNMLSLLDSLGDFEKLRCLNVDQNDNLNKLGKSSHFSSFGSSFEASKFLEYWVPVQISNYQLELYCDALFNSNALRSCSRNDSVGAFRDILVTVQKFCDHPYLVDSSIQKVLFAEQRPVSEILDIGIKASGKLHLLDLMLAEVKTQKLKALILYQTINGPEGASIGDILDDFIRQRFGENAYERVDSRVIHSKKQAAMFRFNKKDAGRFVFLLENRACSCSIKMSSLDLIIIYDSDWNPVNDFRALQKISIDSKVKEIKIFRLYSSCTVEERALVLAKQNLNLDHSLQNFSRARSRIDTLLMWGASHLFRKLDEYHAESNSAGLNFVSDQLLLNEVSKEFQAIISENCKTVGSSPLISKVTLDVGSYNTNTPMLGEKKVQLIDGVEPHMFWRNLLDRKRPQWKHLRGPCPRNRKRAQCLVASPRRKSGSENGDASKKCKILVNDVVDAATGQVDLIERQVIQIARSKGEPSTTKASNQSESLPRDRSTANSNANCLFFPSSFVAGVDTCESEERFLFLHEQKSLHGVLQKEVTKLCLLLKLSEDVIQTARRFLEYVIKNHDVRSDSPAFTQAFQISLCWIAALISKQKVDKKRSFILAKQLLNYQCTEEQAKSVYLKMQSLKCIYSQCSDSANESVKDYLLVDDGIDNANEEEPLSTPFKLKTLKTEVEETLVNEDLSVTQIPLPQNLELMIKASGNEIRDKIKEIKEKCVNQMKKFIQTQQEEVRKLQRTWEEEKVKLEADHKLESALTCSIYSEGSTRIFKLKSLEDNFVKKMVERNLLKNMQLKDLKAKQLAARNEERQKLADWVAETITSSSELTDSNREPLDFQSVNDAGCSQFFDCAAHSDPGNVVSMSQQQLENQNFRIIVCAHENDLAPSDTSISARAESVGHRYPAETLDKLESAISHKETEVSHEIQAAVLNKQAPTEAIRTVPRKVVNQRDEPDESSNGDSTFPVSPVLVDMSLNYNQSPQSETEHQNQDRGSSSLTAEAGETGELFQEFVSQSCEASQLQDDNVNLGPARRIDHEQNVDLFTDSLNNMSMAAEAVITELPDQLGTDENHLRLPSHLLRTVHQISPQNSTPSLLAEPLQSELERLSKEAELLEKTHADLVSQLRSDCEMEIQEIVTKIRDKYEVKIKDAEAEFMLKKNEVDKNQNKILMNKILAEAFRFKCLNLKSSWSRGMQQASPSSFMQQLHQILMPPSMRLSGAIACQPFLSQQTTNPYVQAMHQQSQPRSMRSSPVASVTAPPSQALQLSAPLLSGPSSRPPVISSFASEPNPRVGGDIRSPAPHLKPFRAYMDVITSTSQHHPQQMVPTPLPSPPLASPYVVSQNMPEPNLCMSRSQHHLQQLLETSPPAPSLPPSPQLASSNVCYHNMPEHPCGIPNPQNLSISAMNLLRDMNRRLPMNACLSPLPDIDITFGSLEPSDFDNLGNVQNNPELTAVATDICLADFE